MGYRIRLGKVSKEDAEKYRKMSERELVSTFGEGFAYYRPPFHTELYEIGKYVDFPEFRTPFYCFELDEDEFDVMHKRGLERIIESERADIGEYYTQLRTDKDAWERHINSTADEWAGTFNLCPYDMDSAKPLVRSWKREYAIFTLVQLYREFDWDNDLLIYSGW